MVSSTERSGPVFIVGSGRSGTTLLAMLLHSTGEINCRRELGLVYHTLCDVPESVWRCCRSPGMLQLKPTFGEVLSHEYDLTQDEFERKVDGNDSRREFLLSVYETPVGDRETRRWGENTANDSLVMDIIVDEFPTAKFVHMYRDPRDVALSGLGRSFGWSSLRQGLIHWFTLTRSVLRFQRRFPERIIELQYEKLIKVPRTALKPVREFLGITAEVDLEEHFKGYHQDTLQDEYKRPLDPNNTGKWRKVDGFDDSYARKLCGAEMKQLGYLENDHFSFREPCRTARYWWEIARRRWKPRFRTMLYLLGCLEEARAVTSWLRQVSR